MDLIWSAINKRDMKSLYHQLQALLWHELYHQHYSSLIIGCITCTCQPTCYGTSFKLNQEH